MTRARAVRPTDLVALVSFDGRVYPNEAKTRERIGTTDAAPHPLERALEQWFSFATGCHTWISIKGATLRGLISARRRGKGSAWELDCVINAAEDDDSVCLGLLEQALREATRSGVDRVFLRLAAESAVLPLARKIGFVEYQRENLFSTAAPRRMTHEGAAALPVRKMLRSDEYALYQLYNACVPEPVRCAEAMTFDEWKSAQDRNWLVGKVSQRVIEREGRVTACLRLAVEGETARFDLMASAGEPGQEALLDAALAKTAGNCFALTLVPKYAVDLTKCLRRRGFGRGPEYVALVNRTAVTVKVPQLVHAV